MCDCLGTTQLEAIRMRAAPSEPPALHLAKTCGVVHQVDPGDISGNTRTGDCIRKRLGRIRVALLGPPFCKCLSLHTVDAQANETRTGICGWLTFTEVRSHALERFFHPLRDKPPVTPVETASKNSRCQSDVLGAPATAGVK